jgi:hypothetical protein
LIDLSAFLPGLKRGTRTATDDELSPFEYHQRHAPKHGPVKARFITAGQQRRAWVRGQKAANRKANKRYRRQWMANEAAFHTLRSQLALIVERPDSALVPGVVRVLEQRYGSVEEAVEHYTKLADERIQAAKAARERDLERHTAGYLIEDPA